MKDSFDYIMALTDFFTPKEGCTNCRVGEGVEERAPQKQEKDRICVETIEGA